MNVVSAVDHTGSGLTAVHYLNEFPCDRIVFQLVEDACSSEVDVTMCLVKLTICGSELSN